MSDLDSWKNCLHQRFLYMRVSYYPIVENTSWCSKTKGDHWPLHCTTKRPRSPQSQQTRFFLWTLTFGNTDLAGGKTRNYNKFEIVKKQRKSNIQPTCILFLPFDRCYMILPCYVYSIDIFSFIYRLWRWYFFKLFLICTLKDPNLAENLINLVENIILKKVNSAEFME